jgi:hypothetical protein
MKVQDQHKIKPETQSCQTSVMTSYYLVRYSGGSYEDAFDVVVFATNKKSTATKYCTKFNKLLKKWQTHYKQFETKKYGIMTWIADEHIDTKFYRWNKLQKISRCYYEEVSVR